MKNIDIDNSRLEWVADPEVLDAAFQWCCKARAHFPPSADIWFVRERWQTIRPQLSASLLVGTYRFTSITPLPYLR